MNTSPFHAPRAGRRAACLAAAAVALLAAACTSNPSTSTMSNAKSTTMSYKPNLDVPAALKTSDTEVLHSVVFARGVQIYSCTAAANGALAWTFVAPEADLFADSKGAVTVGKHGAGPFWQALDGSKVIGQVKARADAPAAGAIPWLLLSTTADSTAGSYQKVTSIQRLNTVGGLAPSTGCTAADAGKRVGVPYTSDYALWMRRA